MVDSYSLRNISHELPETLKRYLEAQYHIWDDHLVAERRRLLDEPGVIFHPPFVEATPAYETVNGFDGLGLPPEVRAVLEIAASNSRSGIPATPYAHQAEALQAYFAEDSNPTELVISTGTGSGKTESFLMPIVGSLAIERTRRPDSFLLPAARAILLYPMNALVNDQVSRLRRLLGSKEIGAALRRADGHSATFGFYTSRTPYPGDADPARTRRDVGGWIKKFFEEYVELRRELVKEGKWPAKCLGRFRRGYKTSPKDRELLTRHEMQARPPDVLVTNYSMLEYMLLRPVDGPIFDKTERWLAHSPDNRLTVVLDEAHLYQGAQGSEVALLLRRLRSRLRVPRQQVRFILTSASLSEGTIRQFATQLTGALNDGQSFHIIRSKLKKQESSGTLSPKYLRAFANLDLEALHRAEEDIDRARKSLELLLATLGITTQSLPASLPDIKNGLYESLERTPAYTELAAQIMGRPTKFSELARNMFGQSLDGERALDGLLAATAFARRAVDGKVLLPSRAHFLFRGLAGVHACTNSHCSARPTKSGPTLLGRLYEKPTLHCNCGSRVYELLTHRECGAAFLRGFYDKNHDDFLWHEPSTGVIDRNRQLREVHLLVECKRDRQDDAATVWLHTPTGKLLRNRVHGNNYLELKWPHHDGLTTSAGRELLTFDRQCPVCLGEWRDLHRPKIMDLVTKGEDPFAHLIATQVRLQPASRKRSDQSPNAGRKSLLFSDGRQKAARLALDVPRVLGLDAFRQAIMLATQELVAIRGSASLSDRLIYPAFVWTSARFHLTFFDGSDEVRLREHEARLTQDFGGNLRDAVNHDEPFEETPPPQFRVELMRLLGSRHYSLYALGVAYIRPTPRTLRDLKRDMEALGLSEADVETLAVIWIDNLLTDFALYSSSKVKKPARVRARGHAFGQVGSKSGFGKEQKKFLKAAGLNVSEIDSAFKNRLTEPAEGSDEYRVLLEQYLSLEPALNADWFRCNACTYLAPVTWRTSCAWCGAGAVRRVPPEGDEYVRARKAFWRSPVTEVLAGRQSPLTLDVQEHTAQLNYRDVGDVEATTETYERRFRDVLLRDERAIDVLSCTTTMEVGIDIGSLIAVGLRNMPPSRHNYQQRAGRAGRRGSAVSTVITFAQHSPHDTFLFDNPSELIAGAPRPAGLDVSNPTIVKRHVFAELIQEYFNKETIRRVRGNVFATLGKTVEFYTGTDVGSFADLTKWIRTSESESSRRRIDDWLPRECGLSADTCAEELIGTLEDWRSALDRGLPRDEEELIEFLFSHGVLPAYAFPRDLVALEIEEQHGRHQTQERPQQGASIALSEYAPGRTVVVNKKKYRIGAVTSSTLKDEVNRAVALFTPPTHFLQCSSCLNTIDINEGKENSDCTVCRSSPMRRIRVIQPQIVWPEGGKEVDELDDEQVFTDTTVAQLPIPSSNSRFSVSSPFGRRARLKFGRLVPLVVVNRGAVVNGDPTGFDVCQSCGYVPLAGSSFPTSHERCYHITRSTRGRLCTGTAQNVYLGYNFDTDVSLLHVPLESPFAWDLSAPEVRAPLQAAALSLANALSIVASDVLGIDQRELQSGFRLGTAANASALVDLYVYDTLAGGAGYSRLVGDRFEEIFNATLARLSSCDCDSSCTRCLRTYANRTTHSLLDRHLGIDLARFAKEGVAPSPYDNKHQHNVLRPFLEMLSLDGWAVEGSPITGAVATREGRQVSIGVRPALLDSTTIVNKPPVLLSEFSLKKDLPSCLLEI